MIVSALHNNNDDNNNNNNNNDKKNKHEDRIRYKYNHFISSLQSQVHSFAIKSYTC